MKILLRWHLGFGLLFALTGELRWLSMVFPKARALIPLARWPGFILLIAAAFKLAKSRAPQTSL